ncbi:MAG: beta-galactosidase [Oscillospiraceae bacterium]|nr:beta-galactosidase [Oscillospiraceae bacterium]
MGGKLYYGAAYYPEQETWDEVDSDAGRFAELGFNAARIGEFAWCRMEPREGEYDFAWLDHVIGALGAKGVGTLLCTPTANPPIWMVEKYPEIMYVDNRGVTRPFGGRRHYCYNSPAYRGHCARIASELARRYGGDANVIGFHIDNELAQEATGRCHCPVCLKLFQDYLERKYGDVGSLNERWGTVFWGQTYERFDQIGMPVKSVENGAQDHLTTFRDNPAMRLDYERFCSDSLIAFQNVQADAIREHSGLPVTSNGTTCWTNGIDYHEAFRGLDVVASDIYPPLRTNEGYSASFDMAFSRGLKAGLPFWVVETSSGGGHGVWANSGVPQPYPGALRQNAMHIFASGGALATYFQFKTFRFGAEQLEASVFDVNGAYGRRQAEFAMAAKEMRRFSDLLTESSVEARAAIVYDYDSLWATKIKPINPSFSYELFCHHLYGQLARLGIGADLVKLDEGINRYKAVILPAQVIMGEAQKAVVRDYVNRGGYLLATFLTALKNADNAAERKDPPAGLTDLFGVRVVEGEPVFGHTRADVTFPGLEGGLTGRNEHWTESLEILPGVSGKRAVPVAVYADTYRKGEVTVAEREYGEGLAAYMGSVPEAAVLRRYLKSVCERAGVTGAPFGLPEGVEAVTRLFGDSKVYFVFNFREAQAELTLGERYTDLASGRILTGTVMMAPKEYIVLTGEGIQG